MKKYLAAGLVVIMSFAMSITALAAPSITSSAKPVEDGAKDKNGTVIVVEVKAPASEIIASAVKTETVKEVLAEEFKETMEVVDVVEVTVPEDTEFPVTITFSVTGVKAGDTVYVMHWNGTSWEKINATAGEGTITATFQSLSPVAFVVDQPAAEPPAEATDGAKSAAKTSPKMGEEGIAGVGFMAILALAGILVINKKRVRA